MKLRSKLLYATLVVAFLFSSVALVQTGDLYFQIKKQLTIFGDVYKEVATLYVDEVSPEKLMKSSIDAMLQKLDPYTVFIAEGEQQDMEILSTGSYGGVGIEVGFRGDDIVVIAPMEGYAADRAGIRPGDILKAINGVSAEGLAIEEVQELTIGDTGTTVKLLIQRPSTNRTTSYELERERIEVKNISFTERLGENNDLLYLQLSRFGQQSGEEVRELLLNSREEDHLNGLILDLRNNPGGLLNEAVEIIDKFIEPGVTVVETQGRMEEQNGAYVSEEPAIFDDLPVIILMNRGSASASEVVAGALQDLDRAVIIGESSFGKGLVQTIRPLSYNTSLKLTVSKYLTPSGRSIQSVDYAGENGGIGSQIPDSLRRPFKTKNGRTVFDGQGIDPDVVVNDSLESEAEISLLQSNHIFFFVNEKLAAIDDESPELPPNIFDQFVDYLNEQNFEYSTPADEYINELETYVEQSSNNDRIREDISNLKRSLSQQKQQEILSSKNFIENSIEKEWISQVHGRDERNRISLQEDGYVRKAVELLLDNDSYQSILKP
ncbi:MAG: S41 family peptidase [Balneolaceae bacterium]